MVIKIKFKFIISAKNAKVIETVYGELCKKKETRDKNAKMYKKSAVWLSLVVSKEKCLFRRKGGQNIHIYELPAIKRNMWKLIFHYPHFAGAIDNSTMFPFITEDYIHKARAANNISCKCFDNRKQQKARVKLLFIKKFVHKIIKCELIGIDESNEDCVKYWVPLQYSKICGKCLEVCFKMVIIVETKN